MQVHRHIGSFRLIAAIAPTWSTCPWVTQMASSVAPDASSAASSRGASSPGSMNTARCAVSSITR